MSEETAKVVVDETPTAAEKETQVLESAGVDTKTNDGVYKVDLSQPKTTQDEVQDEEQEQISNQAEKELQEINEEVAEESVLEALEDADEPEVVVEETTKKEVIQESKDNGIELPENIQKVVDFMNETGGSLEDYVRLNTDFDQLSPESLLQEYYKQTKSHLDPEEIEFLIEDNFSYDEDLDEERDIRRKKLAYKEEIAKAKQFLEESKAKYYDEVKLNSKLLPDQQKAIDFFNRYNQEQSETRVIQEKQIENFKNKTDSLFSDNFKGFDFKVGEQKYRFNVKDAQSVKDKQSDISNFIGKFLDKNNMLSDASGYHKALFVANNADAIANHFYEQGKADAVKQISTEAKNINMDPRKTSQGIIETGGIKVKAISGDDSSKLRIKLKK
jgi:hypothetical protein